MNIGLQLDWAGTTYYVSTGHFSYNNIQYPPDIVSISPLTWAGALWGNYEASTITVELKDNSVTSYRALLADEATRYPTGGDAKIIKSDGSIIGNFVIQGTGINQKTITLTLSNKIGEFEKKPVNSDMVITDENFKNSPKESRGKTIPWFSGQFRAPSAGEKGKNSIRAYRVTSNQYILGESGITDTLTLQFVTLPNGGADVTGSCTLIPPAGGDPYYYVQYAGAAQEYLDVNFNFPFKKTQAIGRSIGTRFFPNFNFRATDSDGMTVFDYDEWHLDSVPGLRGGTHDTHYAITEQVTGIELLSDICKMLNVHWYIDDTKKIYFTSIDFANLTIDKTFQPGVSGSFIANFPWQDNASEVLNTINAEIAYQYNEGAAGDTKLFKKTESISRFGETYNTSEFESCKFWGLSDAAAYPRYDAKPHVVRKKIMTELSFPQRERSFTANMADVGELKPLDIVKFSHPLLEDSAQHLFLIRRIRFDFTQNAATLDMIDVSRYENLDTDQVFLLQSDNANGSKNFYDESVAGTNFLTGAGGSIAHDTSDSKYGNSCITFNGTNQFLKFGNSERFYNFDPWDINHNAFSIWLWVKFNSLDTPEFIAGQYENNTTDFWRISKRGVANGNVLRFVAFEASVNEITVNGATAITDTNWHLVTFGKTGTTYFFYLDGVQDAKVIDVDTGTINEGFFIGAEYSGSSMVNYANIKIASLGIWKNITGPLSAPLAPGLGNDSFTVPVGLWGESTNIPLYVKV